VRYRFAGPAAGMMAAASMFLLTAHPAVGQALKSPSAAPTWAHPKTPWGDPDLQGTWTSDDCIGTPMNRPAKFGNRLYYTEQELAERQNQIKTQHENDLVETVAAYARVGTGPPSHWGERARRPCKQTSLVEDPPDGQTPALLPDARSRFGGEPATNNNPKADSWEDFSYYIRCITRGVVGSIYPVVYGNGQEIVQAPGYVAIMQEMVHEARIIPLDGRPHASAEIRTYMGDPRGHWEGNTLVVETTNFLGNRTSASANGWGTPLSDALKLVERYTRFGPNGMRYEVTVDDPKTYVRPFKIGFPLTQEPGYQNFEYACHEGNYAMFDTLSGARAKEREKATAPAVQKQ
jgi:hypothetical protein